MMKLLYFAPASYGGLADYAHEQAEALAALGVDVTLLCETAYPLNGRERYKTVPTLRDYSALKAMSNKYLKAIEYTKIALGNFAKIAAYIEAGGFDQVLFGSYIEYLAPIWSPRFRKLAKKGVNFSAVLHDPFREYVFGPGWWHRWSVACSYSFLQTVFIHQDLVLNTGFPMPNLKICVIPHGPYDFGDATLSREEVRAQFDLPIHAKVLLAFGNIRDNKNLDLVLQAMVHLPDVYLIVAGKEQLSSQRPIGFYQKMAVDLGIADRCRWQHGFIPSAEIPNLFAACDLILLTYSKTFQSASGVLNAAIKYRKMCVASSGEGPLHSVLKQYNLGVWVEPDDVTALVAGITRCFADPPVPLWDKYAEENSWQKNAWLVVEALEKDSLQHPQTVIP